MARKGIRIHESKPAPAPPGSSSELLLIDTGTFRDRASRPMWATVIRVNGRQMKCRDWTGQWITAYRFTHRNLHYCLAFVSEKEARAAFDEGITTDGWYRRLSEAA